MLLKGWKLSGSQNHLILYKGNLKIKVDIKIKTPKGILFVIKIKRRRAMYITGIIYDSSSQLSRIVTGSV